MSDPASVDRRKACPMGHVPDVHYGEEKDIVYCQECSYEGVVILAKRRENVKKTELSRRERGVPDRQQRKR